MTVPSKILSAIQKTGQTVYDAQRDVAAFASEQSRGLRKAISRKDASPAEVDATFAAWKAYVQLSQDLKEVNDRLAALYAAASKVSSASKGPAATGTKAKRKTRRAATPVEPPTLRGNNAKLLSYLSGMINRETFTGVTQALMAEGAAIPLGSVAYSVGRLIKMGVIEEGLRGEYKLI